MDRANAGNNWDTTNISNNNIDKDNGDIGYKDHIGTCEIDKVGEISLNNGWDCY